METKTQTADKLVDLLKDINVCMLLTGNNPENLYGRPMGVTKVDADGTLWFFTKASSHKAGELEKNNKVALTAVSESANTYLMIRGKAELSYDKNKMRDLWSPAMKAWFPEGLEDADMALIKVSPHEADYWDSSSSKMVVVFNMLKSIVTGEEYNEGEQGKIKL